jgi:hypothetical protein
MNGQPKVDWTKWAAIGTLIAAGVYLGMWWDARSKKPASLVVPPTHTTPKDGVEAAPECMPWGPNLPTPISFRNDGDNEALVKQVILSHWKWIPTPRRPNIFGAGRKISVTFEPRHYVKQKGQYMLVLRNPAPVEGGGKWTTLEVSLVDPSALSRIV